MMRGLSVDPDLPLELLNGGGMLIEFFFIVFLTMYLWKETKRRGWGWKEWSHWMLPPSMNLAVAVLVFDCGVFVRTVVVWSWRKFYGPTTDFSFGQIFFLALGAAVIIIGGLCKIRAVSYPDYGHAPWIITWIVTLLFIVFSVVFR